MNEENDGIMSEQEKNERMSKFGNINQHNEPKRVKKGEGKGFLKDS